MLDEMRERLGEVLRSPWQALSTAGFAGLSVVFGLVALLQVTSREGWVPLLDSANLVFHEAGHPLFSPLGETLGILGGTLMQLLVPLLVATSGLWKRQAALAGFGAFWAAQNLHNIARYVADARSMALPLAGGGEHDWNTLLEQWGLLHRDAAIGAGLHAVGWLGMGAAWAWVAWRWWRSVNPR